MSAIAEVLTELRAIRSLLAEKNGITRLSKEQAANSLNISVRTFDRVLKSGAIKRDQENGPIRFRSTDIEAYKLNGGAVLRAKRQYNKKPTP